MSTGISSKGMDALGRMGVTVCYASISRWLERAAEETRRDVFEKVLDKRRETS
jgi:hypothetical protein